MLRVILTTTALLAVCAAPAFASTYEEKFRTSYQPVPAAETGGQDLRSPDAVDAAAHRGVYAREGERSEYVLNRGYGSPDAADAARDLPPMQVPVVAAQANPSNGFDWGDAGIGAAGMLGLFGIAGASALMLTGRKRRHGLKVTTP
jgi:hypothetical protein